MANRIAAFDQVFDAPDILPCAAARLGGAMVHDALAALRHPLGGQPHTRICDQRMIAKVIQRQDDRRWNTPLTLEQFGRVTGATQFPAFLAPHVKDGVLQAPANGEFTYTLKGIHARVSVTWDFEAPPGAGEAGARRSRARAVSR